MKIADLRSIMEGALSRVGLEESPLVQKKPKVWCLPGGEVIRFFQPAAYKRGWGFVYTGFVGIELPQLRKWLVAHDHGQPGIFRHSFVAHHTLNDDDRDQFMIDLESEPPVDRLAAALYDKVARIPPSMEQLVSAYRHNPASLCGLAGPIHSAAWEFLLRWTEAPDDNLRVPQRGPDGRIVV